MAQTNFSGPIASGDRPAGSPGGANVGFVVLSQSTSVTANSTTSQNVTLRVPRGTQLIDFKIDVRTIFNGTTPVLAAGTTVGGTEYLSAVSLGTVGRRPLGLTGPQVEALQSVLNNRDVVFTISAGTANTAGLVYIEMQYVQKSADD
jgi:hypothetical protein